MQDRPVDTFLAHLEQALAAGGACKLVLVKPRSAASDLLRVTARPVLLRGAPCLSLVYTHKTRDLTRNLPFDAALVCVRDLMRDSFLHAHLFDATHATQLLVSRKKGTQTVLRSALGRPASSATTPETAPGNPLAAPPAALPGSAAHDRVKQRYVDIREPFLVALGVTDAAHQLVPAMARKWKQINKFIEVLDHALDASGLKRAARIDVLDFGSGKGYLTFAMHHHLRHTLALPATVTGVELRADMVALCNAAVRRLGPAQATPSLRFDQGDVRSRAPQPVDIMVALHACDTATDHALHTGVQAGAQIIMCSPCCHKELRPQLLSPHPLRPILKHGVHLGQEAEMLTDGLRALMLEACGYDTQVFEFVALEHTNKNKMILAVKRTRAARASAPGADAVWQQIAEIKSFYGVREHCLETLLKAAAMAAATAAATSAATSTATPLATSAPA